MASSFGGINTALTSLYAQRRGLDVTGQNIANANTEGYTRQRVEMQSQVGSLSAAMYARTDGLGTGVGVSAVQRLRDEYLENRGRAEHSTGAFMASQSASYTSIEDAFAEPSDTALAAQLRDMWGSWNDVANNPQLAAPRSALIQQSSTVADQLNAAQDALARQWSQNQTQMAAYVDEVNVTAGSIAQLNDSIIKANAADLTVNELEDRRDLLAMKLSELTGATAAKRENGGMDVFIGGSTLVSGTYVREVDFVGATAAAGGSGHRQREAGLEERPEPDGAPGRRHDGRVHRHDDHHHPGHLRQARVRHQQHDHQGERPAPHRPRHRRAARP
jgi:flagellar hook-associated protein 1 FlgK